MGESAVAREAYTADHTGASFMISHIPVVKSVTPTRAGTLGGTVLTITGDGFSKNASVVHVDVAGRTCRVHSATIEQIVCELEPYVPARSPSQDDQVIGDRGINMRLWYKQGRASFDSVRAGRVPPPNVSGTISAFYEAPQDILYASGADVGPAGIFEGYFRAPVASQYTFLLASDDFSELWVGRNASSLTNIISFRSWTQHRDYTMNWEYSGGRYDPYYSMQYHRTRSSQPLWLNKGEFIFTRTQYSSSVGGDHCSLAVKIHTSSVGRKHTPHAVDEKQVGSLVLV